MLFSNLPGAKPATRRAHNAPVFCVGWRAFVNWPAQPGRALGPMPLTDRAGQELANDLADGQEVEIVSWQPRAREGATYQVRRIADGTEWQLPATCLRRHVQPDAAVPPSPPPSARR